MEPRGENSISYRIINPNPNPNPTLDQNHLQQNLDPDPTHSKTPQAQSPQHQVQLEAENERISPVRYRECLKNHAANIGGHVTDGCGEFMPSGDEGTPEALRCAACDCHRNFHRKESNENNSITAATANTTSSAFFQTPPRHSLFTMPPQRQQYHKLPHNHFYGKNNSPTAPIMMSFGVYGGGGGGAAGESSSEDLNMFNCNIEGQRVGQTSLSKKRFRTKFTQEQKERMHVFAEKVGWKIQKQDEQELQQFCDELGIKRQVFKVWMHNNKQAMKKKEI